MHEAVSGTIELESYLLKSASSDVKQVNTKGARGASRRSSYPIDAERSYGNDAKAGGESRTVRVDITEESAATKEKPSRDPTDGTSSVLSLWLTRTLC